MQQTQQNESNGQTRIGQSGSKSITSARANNGEQRKVETNKDSTGKKFKMHRAKIATADATTKTMLNMADNDAEMEDAHLSTREKMAKQGAAAIE
eukprot:2728798-Ditylum_brightwellii.AAC.1